MCKTTNTKNLNLYAYNENKTELLYSITHFKKKGEKYYCPNCMDEMGLRKGEIKIHHFYHKNEECSYESYLHKIAKITLYENLQKYDILNFKYANIFKTKNLETYKNKIIDNNYERLDIIFQEYFISETKYGKLLRFFEKIKKETNQEIINMFLDFHKWLKSQIEEKIEEKKISYNKYMKKYKEGFKEYPKMFSLWENDIKQKNSLIENILFNNKFKDILHINIIKYFNEQVIDFDDLKLMLKLFYKPQYKDKLIKIQKDINFDTKKKKEIYLDNKMIDNFKPDILYINTDEKITFFEIKVNNGCSKEKKLSNYDVIEIEIKSINDIDNLISNNYSYNKTNIYSKNLKFID